jgi:IclR family pca regulon transcriptional regulator
MDEFYARAMGKAVLANLDPAELSNILEEIQFKKHTPNTLPDKEAILKDIELTRNRGYSINNEEYVEGLICIGAPLMNFRENTVVGAVSLDFPTSEYSLDSIMQNYPGVLTKLASELSETVTSIDI